ncbi:hypothetical protein [Erythrobacter sp.]|jgi:predicted small secreted protein|nr:hypothetical protein [Erythrobacter sp.]
MRKILSAVLLGMTVVTLTACNTVRGAGEDLKSVADAVDRET